jgi:hypothetical protein
MVNGAKSNRSPKNPHSGPPPNAKHKKGAAAAAAIDAADLCGPIVLTLNPHDVILGRGAPTAFYEGNVKFRALAALHKPDYMAGGRHHPKQAIAMRVLNEVHQRGGRFVQETILPPPPPPPGTAVAALNKPVKAWQVVAHNTALEKVKQALRAKGSYEDVPMYPQDAADLALPIPKEELSSSEATLIQPESTGGDTFKPSSVVSADTSNNGNDQPSRPSVAAMTTTGVTMEDVSGRSQGTGIASSDYLKDVSRSVANNDAKSSPRLSAGQKAACIAASAVATTGSTTASLMAAIQGQVNPTFAATSPMDQGNALLVQHALRQRQQLAALRNSQQQMDQLRANLLLQQHQAAVAQAQQQQLWEQRLLQQQLAASLGPSVAAGLFGGSLAAGAGSLLLQPAISHSLLAQQQLLSTPQPFANWLNFGGGASLNLAGGSAALGGSSLGASPAQQAALLLSATGSTGSAAAAPSSGTGTQ